MRDKKRDDKRRATRFGPKDVTRPSSFSDGTMPLYRRMGREGTEMNGEGKNGGGAGTRTPDTGIMIPLLYQLSYTAPGKILEAYDTVFMPFCQEEPIP